jgi:SAM-dependent methyltransferase
MDSAQAERAERERAASNEGGVYRRYWQIRNRFAHVHECPNSAYAEARSERMLAEAARGKAVLDFGCGNGHLGRVLVAVGAASVHGIDISERWIEEAKLLAAGDPRLRYDVADVTTFAGGPFDVIVGNAILHHLDWRPLLKRLYDELLAPGGVMFFSEPMGSNLGLRLYWRLFPGAHTDDEAPFYRRDIRWLRETFPGFELYPTNYVSLYAGLVSSQLFKSADNALMRVSDRIDRTLEKIEFMKPAFRYGLLVIRKPA